MNRLVLIAPLVAVAVALSGCATKKYVNDSVAQVNDKVTSLSKSLEETQERTRQNEARIQQVDDKYGKQVAVVDEKASAAGKAAAAAQSTAQQAILRAEEVDKAVRKLIYQVTISEASGNFRFGQTDLPDAARAQIDQLVERLKADPTKGAYIEIEGHTDNVGDTAVNERIGLMRAESVKRYLYEKHGVPLHKMNVISYGEDRPAAPNTTREGRAQNRRVVIRVLS